VGFKTAAAVFWTDLKTVWSFPMWWCMALAFAMAQGIAAVFSLYGGCGRGV
jgi:hypothetical protein